MAINTFRATVLLVVVLGLLLAVFHVPEEGKVRLSRAAVQKSITSIVYWGQNRLGPTVDARLTEPSLLRLCSETAHEAVIISFVKKHFSTNGLPGLDLSNHCTTTTFSSDTYGVDAYPLLCPEVASHITQCQALGKKVLISVSPMDSLGTAENAVKSATNIWNYFLGGTATNRPFGNVVLDGVDLYFRNSETFLIKDFALALSSRMAADRRVFFLTVSCRGQFPDANYGPVSTYLLTNDADKVSMIILHALGSPDFSYSNKQAMYANLQKWFAWSPKPIYIAFPGYDSHVDGMPGDFISPTAIMNDTFFATIRGLSSVLKGFAVFEGSAEMGSKPCSNDQDLIDKGFLTTARKYGDLLRSQFLLPVSTIGSNTPNSSWCDPYVGTYYPPPTSPPSVGSTSSNTAGSGSSGSGNSGSGSSGSPSSGSTTGTYSTTSGSETNQPRFTHLIVSALLLMVIYL